MRKVTRAALALAGSAALIGVTTVPSFAADSSTPVTVTVPPGVLAITVPESATFTITDPAADATNLDSTATATLGTTKVTDTRAGTTGWGTTVSLPDLTGTATPAKTLDTATATYLVGARTILPAADSAVVVTPVAAATGLDAVSPTLPPTSLTISSVTGNNSVAWPATLTVEIPATTQLDAYVGTLTQSVS